MPRMKTSAERSKEQATLIYNHVSKGVISDLCDKVREDLQRELETTGETSDDTMAVRGWLKKHNMWHGEDI